MAVTITYLNSLKCKHVISLKRLNSPPIKVEFSPFCSYSDDKPGARGSDNLPPPRSP